MFSQLVLREYPDAKPVDGIGGDQGLDIYEGVSPSKPKVVWQAKLFYDPLRTPQKRQIRESFEKVGNVPGLIRWILCIPRNLNVSEQEWLQSLRSEHLGSGKKNYISIDWWGETRLRELLLKHPDIAFSFFPDIAEQPPEQSLIVHGFSAGQTDVEFMLTNVSNNTLIVNSIYLEVTNWEPIKTRQTIGARVMTYKYEVTLTPSIREYIVTGEKFKYSKGDVDNFTINFISPPGNRYIVRLRFNFCDIKSGKEFSKYSEEFELRFPDRSWKSGRLILVE